MVKHLEKEEEFEKFINQDNLCIVDFYAEWCGPCKMLAPILESLDVPVLKIDTDQFMELSRQFGIMSIPTLIFFKKGEMLRKEIGFRNQDELEEIIKSM